MTLLTCGLLLGVIAGVVYLGGKVSHAHVSVSGLKE